MCYLLLMQGDVYPVEDGSTINHVLDAHWGFIDDSVRMLVTDVYSYSFFLQQVTSFMTCENGVLDIEFGLALKFSRFRTCLGVFGLCAKGRYSVKRGQHSSN